MTDLMRLCRSVTIDEAFLAEISLRSPRKLLLFSYQKFIFRINVSKKTVNLILKNASLVTVILVFEVGVEKTAQTSSSEYIRVCELWLHRVDGAELLQEAIEKGFDSADDEDVVDEDEDDEDAALDVQSMEMNEDEVDNQEDDEDDDGDEDDEMEGSEEGGEEGEEMMEEDGDDAQSEGDESEESDSGDDGAYS